MNHFNFKSQSAQILFLHDFGKMKKAVLDKMPIFKKSTFVEFVEEKAKKDFQIVKLNEIIELLALYR